MEPFEIRDCALLTRMSGLPAAVNLRELRDRISICSPEVLYHHFCETPMVPTFDNPDYRNDLAVWVKLDLGDRVLSERLGIIDPYGFADMEELRGVVLDLIDERLSEVPVVPFALPGAELYFMQATTVVFNSGRVIEHPGELPDAVRRMTNGSIYFHFLEARRRSPAGTDDFTAWLSEWGSEYESSIQRVRRIDFVFLSLTELRSAIAGALAETGVTP